MEMVMKLGSEVRKRKVWNDDRMKALLPRQVQGQINNIVEIKKKEIVNRTSPSLGS